MTKLQINQQDREILEKILSRSIHGITEKTLEEDIHNLEQKWEKAFWIIQIKVDKYCHVIFKKRTKSLSTKYEYIEKGLECQIKIMKLRIRYLLAVATVSRIVGDPFSSW